MKNHSSAEGSAQEHFAGLPDFTGGAEDRYDFNHQLRQSQLAEAIRQRQGSEDGSFSARYILETAAYRYFQLLDLELTYLQGWLTESEFVAILNTTPHPEWSWRADKSLAGAVADTHGIESLDEQGPMVPLVKKLTALTPAQCLALADVCERFWRTPNIGEQSLSDIAAECGLKLA